MEGQAGREALGSTSQPVSPRCHAANVGAGASAGGPARSLGCWARLGQGGGSEQREGSGPLGFASERGAHVNSGLSQSRTGPGALLWAWLGCQRPRMPAGRGGGLLRLSLMPRRAP